MNARQIPACEVRAVSTGIVLELSRVVSLALLAKLNAVYFCVCRKIWDIRGKCSILTE